MRGTERHGSKKVTKRSNPKSRKSLVEQEPRNIPSIELIELARSLESGNVLVSATSTQKRDPGFEFVIGLGHDEGPEGASSYLYETHLSKGQTSEVFEVKAKVLWSSHQAQQHDFIATEKVNPALPILCLKINVHGDFSWL